MATQKDVAKLAKVSFITVSRVINNVGNVRPETRKRVEAAIKELNYYPNSIAQGLNSNKVKTLAVEAALNENVSIEGTSYYRRVLIGIETYCLTKEYDILLTSQRGDNNSIDFLKPFYERKADGIISIGSKPSKDQLEKISSEGIPCVLIGERELDPKINYIDTQNMNGMYQITEYLKNCGHTKIGYIKGNHETQNASDRYKGFEKAMHDFNIPINSDWIFSGDYTSNAGAEALDYYLTLEKRPTAVISNTDLMAIGFYEQALKLNVTIPDDISLIGFDGHEICSYTNPPIATMIQPLEDMGSEAAKLIIEQIENEHFKSKQLLLPVTLSKGGSVKKITGQ